MFLTEDYNALIEATKSALYLRHTGYPIIPNEKKLPNHLKVELRRPASSEGHYEISFALVGPWKGYVETPVLLHHMFHNVIDNVLNMQQICGGSFITIFEYKLEPKPQIVYGHPVYVPNDSQWIIDLKRLCKEYPGIPMETMTEIVFKSFGSEGLDDTLAKNFEDFLQKTCFMFYDISFEFTYQGKTFQRDGNLEVPVPISTSGRIKKFLKYALGKAESVGSTWTSMEEEKIGIIPYDVTAVSYGVPGDGKYLPAWVLGPSGVPVLGFNTTLFTESLCKVAELPEVLVKDAYTTPTGLPSPDICLQVPSQHPLAKRNHFLVIVLSLPLKYRQFLKHVNTINMFDAFADQNKNAIVEVMHEVLQSPCITEEGSNDLKICRGIAAALGSIIRMSFNTDFSEKCYQLLEVSNSIDGENEMEDFLLNYLQEEYVTNKMKVKVPYHFPRNPNLPPKDSEKSREEDEDSDESVQDSESSQASSTASKKPRVEPANPRFCRDPSQITELESQQNESAAPSLVPQSNAPEPSDTSAASQLRVEAPSPQNNGDQEIVLKIEE